MKCPPLDRKCLEFKCLKQLSYPFHTILQVEMGKKGHYIKNSLRRQPDHAHLRI